MNHSRSLHLLKYPQKIRRRLGVNDKLVFAAYEERPEDAKVMILEVSQLSGFVIDVEPPYQYVQTTVFAYI